MRTREQLIDMGFRRVLENFHDWEEHLNVYIEWDGPETKLDWPGDDRVLELVGWMNEERQCPRLETLTLEMAREEWSHWILDKLIQRRGE